MEAFKSTLEEAVLADFIILVLDASNPYMEDHRITTLGVLAELGAVEKEIVTVYNKIDAIDDPVMIARLRSGNPDAMFISAVTGTGLDKLCELLDEKISSSSEIHKISIPPTRHDLISKLHSSGNVISIKYDDLGNAVIHALISTVEKEKLKPFLAD